MNIVIHVRAHFDWEEVPKGVVVTQADHDAKLVKEAHDGRLLMRVEKEIETFSTFGIPESAIIEVVGADATPSARGRFVAQFLERHLLPHHTRPEHFTKIDVDGEPEVEAVLSSYFGVEPEAPAARSRKAKP